MIKRHLIFYRDLHSGYLFVTPFGALGGGQLLKFKFHFCPPPFSIVGDKPLRERRSPPFGEEPRLSFSQLSPISCGSNRRLVPTATPGFLDVLLSHIGFRSLSLMHSECRTPHSLSGCIISFFAGHTMSDTDTVGCAILCDHTKIPS